MSADARRVNLRLRRNRRRRSSLKRLSRFPGAGTGGRFRILVRAVVATVFVGGTGSLVFANTDVAQAAQVNYVALGDSYSSGVGAGDYDTIDADCKRSANAYSQRWAKEFSMDTVAKFTFVACSGAKTVDVESKQLSSLGTETTMVTMSIGGNDLGFAPIVAECLLTDLFNENLCVSTALAAGVLAESSMPAKLDALYKKIKVGAPNAQVFILGYPHIFELGYCGTFSLGTAARKAINDSTSALNRVTRTAATANGFTFIDVEKTFAGRGVCTTDPGGAWLTDTSAGLDLYHPNADGQEAYAVVLDAAVRGVGLPVS
jgi:lysophospholipase L1-like esterase